ncbi:MAG: VWA domain-containing protein [Planctomycetaceae bacterium]|nr:VWA domain-containing protein [Planctomycetaceae bacterium]
MRLSSERPARRGVFLVIAALCLMVCMTFIAFAIDIGMISLTKTQMQSATDSAALAAAMEITEAISTAGENVSDVFAYAQEQARAEAVSVANLNGVYVDSGSDVHFGRRYTNAAGVVTFDWSPAGNQVNAVKVIARRDNADKNAPDGRLAGMFSCIFDTEGSSLKTESISYIEPRDMVVVHDFSRSMNFDSYFNNEASTNLPQAQLEANMLTVWNDLGLTLGTLPFTPVYVTKTQSTSGANATVTFKGTSVQITSNTRIKSVVIHFEGGGSQTFSISGETTTTGTWTGTSRNSGKRIGSVGVTVRKVGSTTQSWTLASHLYDTSTMQAKFGLGSVSWPYAGGSWSGYLSFVKTNGGIDDYGYRDKYGGMTLVCYLLKSLPNQSQCKDLWKTRHYPFHAIKEGHELLCDYLSELGLDDHLGMVSYDWSHRIETTLSSATNADFPNVNISSDPITNDYAAVKKLMHYKQAAHYSSYTNIAGGMKDAVQLLDDHKRIGSRPAIILMTDGNANVVDPGENSAPVDNWNWNDLFDYDGDGQMDFQTSDQAAKCTLNYVKQAADKGYTVHCISVGVDADADLMEAIAWLGRGYHINVPGGSSVSDMEAQVKAAFVKIAAAVPPARLVSGE